jgi:hypothetical protein
VRWLALILLVLNCVVWFQATRVSAPPADVREGDAGVLPRVADLRPTGDDANSDPGTESDDLVLAPREQEGDPSGAAGRDPGLCYRFQWFASRESANAFRARHIPDAVVRELERELPPLHWVIIPPRPPAQARALFRELQARGVDSYLVREGENRNAISLGLFENPESARQVLAQRKSQNLNAVLAKFPRNQISYALDFEPDRNWRSEAGAMPDFWRDNPLDLIEIEGCKGVASAEKNP